MSAVVNRSEPYLSVLAQVCPHARAVTSAHQNVISEVIDPGHLARELPGGRVVVVPQVRDHVVEPQHLITLVRIFQTHVKCDLGVISNNRANVRPGLCPSRARYDPGGTRSPGVPPVSRWPSRTGWTGLAGRTPRSGSTRPTHLAFSPLRQRGRGDRAELLHDLHGARARFGAVRVTDHPTGAHHLVVRVGLGTLHQQGDGDDERQHHDDAHHGGDDPLPLEGPRGTRYKVRFALGRDGGRCGVRQTQGGAASGPLSPRVGEKEEGGCAVTSKSSADPAAESCVSITILHTVDKGDIGCGMAGHPLDLRAVQKEASSDLWTPLVCD